MVHLHVAILSHIFKNQPVHLHPQFWVSHCLHTRKPLPPNSLRQHPCTHIMTQYAHPKLGLCSCQCYISLSLPTIYRHTHTDTRYSQNYGSQQPSTFLGHLGSDLGCGTKFINQAHLTEAGTDSHSQAHTHKY